MTCPLAWSTLGSRPGSWAGYASPDAAGDGADSVDRCDGPGGAVLVATTPWAGSAGTLALLPYPCVDGAAARVCGLGAGGPSLEALGKAQGERVGERDWVGSRRVRFSRGGHYAVALDGPTGVVTQWRRVRPGQTDLALLGVCGTGAGAGSDSRGEAATEVGWGGAGEVGGARTCDKVARLLAATGYDGIHGDDDDPPAAAGPVPGLDGAEPVPGRQDGRARRAGPSSPATRSKASRAAAAAAAAAAAEIEAAGSDEEDDAAAAEVELEGAYGNRGRVWITRGGDVIWYVAGVVVVRRKRWRRGDDAEEEEEDSEEETEEEAAAARWWLEPRPESEGDGPDGPGEPRELLFAAHQAQVTCLGMDAEGRGLMVTGDAGAGTDLDIDSDIARAVYRPRMLLVCPCVLLAQLALAAARVSPAPPAPRKPPPWMADVAGSGVAAGGAL
jgi:hypothetical protein